MDSNLLKSRNLLSLILCGLFIGFFATFSLPTLIVLALSVAVVYICRRSAATLEEKKFVTSILTLAIVIRVAISVVILGCGIYFGSGSDVFGDALTYEGVGAYINELGSGIQINSGLWGDNLVTVEWLRSLWHDVNLPDLQGGYTLPSVSYWYGYFNLLWGLSFLAPKILNGLMWVLASFWLYRFFHERITKYGTRFGLGIILFLPSALMFSSSGLKDSLLFFLVTGIIFATHKLERSNHRLYAGFSLMAFFPLHKFFGAFSQMQASLVIISLLVVSTLTVISKDKKWLFWGLLIIASSLFLPQLRQYIYFLVLMFGFLILFMRYLNFKRVFIGMFIILMAIGVILGPKGAYSRITNTVRTRMAESVLQSYNTSSGKTSYHIYPEKYYVDINSRYTITFPELFIAYLNGLRHVFLEPMLWSSRSLFAVAMFPEVLFMWIIFPFILLGGIAMLRRDIKNSLPVILFLFFTTSLLALGQGNMGTLVRTRWMVMPWYFMIASVGLYTAYRSIFKARDN